ncbi:hypothetical protein PF005_g3850 [Phytophthora fragariae]|uniref:Uncharacterized protein n=1 Tax=Phytophthora fragariae TaxID=53985 RepID=A0A6A3MNC3_9STRA|nr:hypothetical protein PF003_g2415 [Phytophthora fragariae]KAE8946347.1 hypothetical protein PF009_g4030 [Phytophthora fragariae]KAE9030294.1 hypothetical protein PF011_g693 [Phytophthora fragariae]KAE9128805.1 hypothetical protein PF010_g4364 [Phytophthora fragariae]KAE9132069.1 hypothetical protein PF007_g3863 [Phytophthora fragariae]
MGAHHQTTVFAAALSTTSSSVWTPHWSGLQPLFLTLLNHGVRTVGCQPNLFNFHAQTFDDPWQSTVCAL